MHLEFFVVFADLNRSYPYYLSSSFSLIVCHLYHANIVDFYIAASLYIIIWLSEVLPAFLHNLKHNFISNMFFHFIDLRSHFDKFLSENNYKLKSLLWQNPQNQKHQIWPPDSSTSDFILERVFVRVSVIDRESVCTQIHTHAVPSVCKQNRRAISGYADDITVRGSNPLRASTNEPTEMNERPKQFSKTFREMVSTYFGNRSAFFRR